MKTYDNDGHHFVTATGTLVAFTRCWKWQQGFQDDPTPKERTDKMLQSNLAAIALEISDSGASGMEHSSTRHGAQPTATNRPVPPTLEDISTFVAEIIRDNTFSRIMELVEGSQYYRNDLSEQDVLELIPRGLGLVQVEDGYWLCCRYCKSKMP